MAEVDLEVLDAAHRAGLFKRPPSEDWRKCARRPILTAWELIETIELAGGDGLDVEQIESRIGLNQNTVKIYARWLRSAGLIEWEGGLGSEKIVYYGITPGVAEL